MFSNRGSQYVERIIPALLSDHVQQRSPDGIQLIDLSTAENKLMHDWTSRIIRSSVSDVKTEELSLRTDIGGSQACRTALASFFNTHLGPLREVQPSQVVITPGASVALDALIRNICNPGDAVLIATPYWSGLDISVAIQNEAQVIRVDVPLDEVFDVSVVDRYRQALVSSSVPVRAILVTNPHNPLGRCFPKEVLEALIQFCLDGNLHYISDEVYATSTHHSREEWKNHTHAPYHPFISALSLVSPDSAASKLVHVVYSLSKDFGVSGLRIGALITQSNHNLRMACALVTHAQVSSLTAIAATSLLSPDILFKFLQENKSRIRSAYNEIRDWLSARKIQYISANAGLYIFVRLCDSDDEKAEKALEEQIARVGVRVVRGTNYFCKEPGWFRLVFTLEAEKMRESLNRLDGVLRGL